MTYGSLFSGVGGIDLGFHWAGLQCLWQVEKVEFRRQVLANHWPEVPRFDDVCEVGAAELGRVDIVAGGFPCFPGSTLISTSESLVPIAEIKPGDLVETHRGRYRKVVATMSRDGAPLWNIRAMGGASFQTTKEHPFLVRSRTSSGWGEPEWVETQNLKVGVHYLAQPLRVPDCGFKSEDIDFWRFVGRYLGDGWILDGKRSSKIPQGRRGSRITSRNHKVVICANRNEADEALTQIRAAGFRPTRSECRTTTKFIICSAKLVRFLRPFGRYAHGKKIPSFVYSLSQECLKSLWNGWVDADGHRNQQKRSDRVNTVSPALAQGMARIGRIAFQRPISIHKIKVKPTRIIEGRTVNQRDQYEINRPYSLDYSGMLLDNFAWVPLRGVEETTHQSTVYNIEVEEDESYVAASFAVHNCTGLSSAGKREGFKDPRSALWEEMFRIVCELRPRYVVVENAGSGRSKTLPRVLGDLATVGYDAEWDVLTARAFGAPHLRERIFIIGFMADTDGSRSDTEPRVPARQQGEGLADTDGRDRGRARPSGVPDTNGPKLRDQPRGSSRPDGKGTPVPADNGQEGPVAGRVPDTDRQSRAVGGCFGEDAREKLQAALRINRSAGGAWMAEPRVGSPVDGVPSRLDQAPWERGIRRVIQQREPDHQERLAGQGDAVVPQIAQFIAERILAINALTR